MAFQNYALYPHMTAFENIASPLRSRHVTAAEITARMNETARMLRIDHVLDHLPKALSQGQKQRTALARSLVGRPGIVLLDDPLRNVDAKIRYEMRFELPRVLRRYDFTVVYVTQDYREAMRSATASPCLWTAPSTRRRPEARSTTRRPRPASPGCSAIRQLTYCRFNP